MSATRIRILAIPVLVVAAGLLLAACGSNDSTSGSAATGTTASAGMAGGDSGTVDLTDNSSLGAEILVDSKGRTLYLFEKDDSADESYCYDACAKDWPPLTATGTVTAGSGLDASQVTTFERHDGSTQVAYAGHPLYLYAGDKAAGDTSGNGLDLFGAEWYALDSAGNTVEGNGSSGDGSTTDETTTDDSTSGSGGDSSGSYPSY